MDSFVFSSYNESKAGSPDWIVDFVSGVDKIDLSAFNFGEARLTYHQGSNVSDLAINLGGECRSNAAADRFYRIAVAGLIGG